MARAKKTTKTKEPSVKKGVGSYLANPSSGLSPSVNNLPNQAVGLATLANQQNAVAPYLAYQMSPAVRRAIDAKCNEVSRATPRLFTSDGDEIIGGEVYEMLRCPAPSWTTKRFICDISKWWEIENEIAISAMIQTNGKPSSFLPLAPNRLYPINPTTPNEISDIKEWQYFWNDGNAEQLPSADFNLINQLNNKFKPKVILPKECVIFVSGYNPSSHVRGLSPLISGINSVSCNFQSLRYMKDFYTNNAIPSHIIILEAGLSAKQRKDWEERYLEQYSTFNNQSHKVIVSSGTGVKIEKLDNELNTEKQLDLLKYTDGQIAMLYGVPPTIMGLWDRTRFETANIERSQFLESEILPLCELIQDVIQCQIIERYYPFSKLERGKSKLPIKKNLRNLLDKKLNDKQDSGIHIILDPDTIPLMSQVNMDKFNSLDVIATKAHLSINEAAEYIGLELPYSKQRDRIFIPSANIELSDNPNDDGVLPTNQTQAVEEEEEPQHSNDASKQTMAETEAEEKVEATKSIKPLHKFFRELRKQVLINGIYSLKDIDDKAKELYQVYPKLKRLIRTDRHMLKNVIKDLDEENKKKAVKEFFNKKSNTYLRSII